MKDEVVLIISDYHAPAQHQDAVDYLSAVKKKYKPQRVKLTGDEINWESISYHEKNPDLPGALDELELAKGALRPLYDMFPVADVMESNHGSLPFRKAMTAGLPSRLIRTYNDILEAPKTWVWHFTHVFQTKLGPVFMTHGKTPAINKLSQSQGMSAIQGHYHSKAYISYWANEERLCFDMNVGAMCDDRHLSMAYCKNNVYKSIVGCGVLVNGVPQLVPMVLNAKGRWIGRL
jgi:hypothetical protein